MAKKAAAAPQHQIASRVTGETFHTLAAVAVILGATQAGVIDQALAALVATLPSDSRHAVAVAMKASRAHCPICKR